MNENMDNPKQTVSQTVKEANNVLVTVSSNPSVDQLAACIALTLALNKMGKHATAVFSGVVPSTIEFLQPEKTLEKNTDSLRDFIISLDKAKADKLRYKVEDRVVKIFITPYKTSITEHDLDFSQGDFNVDVVLAIGVHVQSDLDQAITAHGRILHDAKIITINSKPGGELGGINWLQAGASSLSELATELIFNLDKTLIDPQIATALLTGIVAETERFSNALTSPQTMSLSAELMANGANQQLVATKLQAPAEPAAPIAEHPETGDAPASVAAKTQDGMLEITHDKQKDSTESTSEEATPVPRTDAPSQPIVDAVYDPEYKQQTSDADGTKPSEPVAASTVMDELAQESTDDQADQALPPPAADLVADPEGEQAPQIDINEDGVLAPPADLKGDDSHTPEEKAILNTPRNKGVRKNDRPYLSGNPSRRTEDDKALLGMPDVAPEATATIPDGTVASAGLTLPDLDMPLLDRQPLQHDSVIEAGSTDTATVPDQDNATAHADVSTPAPSDTLAEIEATVGSPHVSGITPYEPLEGEPAADTTPASPGLSLPEASPLDTPSVQPESDAFVASPTPDVASTPEATAEPEEDTPSVSDARSAVQDAINAMAAKADQPQHPIQALNAQPLGAAEEIKGSTGIVIVPPDAPEPVVPTAIDVADTEDAGAPPPIPPPMLPPIPS